MDLDFNVAFEPPAKEPEIVENPQAPPRLPTAPPPPPVKLDLRPVALTLMPYIEVCRSMLNVADSLNVMDEDSYKAVTSQAASNKRLLKDLEAARKNFVTPYNHHVAAINNLFRELTSYLTRADETFRAKMKRFDQAQKLERQRKEAEQREANRRLQQQLDAEAAAQKAEAARIIEDAQEKLTQETDPDARATLERTIVEEIVVLETPAPILPPVAIEKPIVTRTTEGSSYTKDKWKVRIIDPDKVPREYCEPSMKLLNAAVKQGGVRHIDGCEITEDLEINIRL